MKILLAIDDSQFSENAIQAVIAQARGQETDVQLLHVVDLLPITPLDGYWATIPDLDSLRKEQAKRGEELVARAAEKLRAAGLKVAARVEEGDPKSKILDLAAEWKVDLVVVGSHGRTGLDRFLLGSVSEGVARHAHCSVLIVRGAGRR